MIHNLKHHYGFPLKHLGFISVVIVAASWKYLEHQFSASVLEHFHMWKTERQFLWTVSRWWQSPAVCVFSAKAHPSAGEEAESHREPPRSCQGAHVSLLRQADRGSRLSPESHQHTGGEQRQKQGQHRPATQEEGASACSSFSVVMGNCSVKPADWHWWHHVSTKGFPPLSFFFKFTVSDRSVKAQICQDLHYSKKRCNQGVCL